MRGTASIRATAAMSSSIEGGMRVLLAGGVAAGGT